MHIFAVHGEVEFFTFSNTICSSWISHNHVFHFPDPPDLASDITISSIKTTSAVAAWAQTTGDFDGYKLAINPPVGVLFNPSSPIPKASVSPTTAMTGLLIGTQYTLSVRTVKGTTEGKEKKKTFNTRKRSITSNPR
jgi:hypothetical protein